MISKEPRKAQARNMNTDEFLLINLIIGCLMFFVLAAGLIGAIDLVRTVIVHLWGGG
jgi:hypothetical protein